MVVAKAEELRNVTIKNIGAGIESLARGDLEKKTSSDVQPLNFNGADEIGLLANSFDNMISGTNQIIEDYELMHSAIKKLVLETESLIAATSEGHLDKRGDADKFEGSFKHLIAGFNTTLNGIVEPLKSSTTTLEIMAQGNLAVRITDDFKGDYIILKDSINKLGDALVSVVAEVSQVISHATGTSSDISASADVLSMGTNDQSLQAAEVSMAISEITKLILSTTQNANNAAIAAERAGEVARLYKIPLLKCLILPM